MHEFEPHGNCYLWTPEVFWPIVYGEIAHTVAYTAIACALLWFIRLPLAQRTANYRPLLLLFATFIFACAGTHAWDLVTIWVPLYHFQAGWLVFSGTLSLATLAFLFRYRDDIRRLGCGDEEGD